MRAIRVFAGLTALGAFGPANPAGAQTALSFVTSQGVQLYDLTYISSTDNTPHLFPGSPTEIPAGSQHVVVFSPIMNDPTLIGQSFQSVFGANEADIAASLTNPSGSGGTEFVHFLTTLTANYAVTLTDPGNPNDVVSVDGAEFSNGRDIGILFIDPPSPITFSVYGLAVQQSSPTPEPDWISMAGAAGFVGIGLAAMRRRRVSAR